MHESQQIGGYILLDRIGAGGMGEVWRAKEQYSDQIVAIKGLKQDADSALRNRFENEVRTLAACEHPHIVPFFAPVVDGDALYLAMRYVSGPNLHDRVRQSPPLTEDDKVAILVQVLDALVYLHEDADVVHRDLKPGNILLDSRGQTYLADFGIAKFQNPDLTQSNGQPIGTTSYMAPEVLKGKAASTRSDVWSFGAVALELFTGRVPYDGIPEGLFAGALTGEIRACLSDYRPDSNHLLEAFTAVRNKGFAAATAGADTADAATVPYVPAGAFGSHSVDGRRKKSKAVPILVGAGLLATTAVIGTMLLQPDPPSEAGSDPSPSSTAPASPTEDPTSEPAVEETTPEPDPPTTEPEPEPVTTESAAAAVMRPFRLRDVESPESTGIQWEDELTIGAKTFPDSILAWGWRGNYIDFPLRGLCESLTVSIGQDLNSDSTEGPGRFTVLLDGSLVREESLGIFDEPMELTVDLTDVNRLRLQDFHDDQDANNVWGTPTIMCSENPNPID